jgi:tRNA-specific 2-thiouridylase
MELENEFEENVVRPFCLEYSRGRTPNPCVPCNSTMKFGVLLDKVRSLGADFLATGHYARLERGADGAATRMRRAADRRKDQSYALWAVPRDRLGTLMFPLGEIVKTDVKRLAGDLGLACAERLESQDVCFVESGDCGDFVVARLSTLGIEVRPGDVVDVSGRALGSHRGLVRFTVGQRRGLGISAAERKYVVELRPESNTVVMGDKRDLLSSEFTCAETNWLGDAGDRLPLRALAQVRYTHQAAPALVEEIAPRPTQRLRVTFDAEQNAVTPGQSAVFYDGDVVLGGGVIETVRRT